MNQVQITLTTSRDAEGRITGTSSSRTVSVPAVEMNPPDLAPLTKGDEEYILVKVSKEKRRCWVTYLHGEDPETEREFYIGTTVAELLAPEHADSRQHPKAIPPRGPRLGEVQLGEMIERRMIERERARDDKKRAGTRGGTHTRFRNLAASEQGEEIPPRELKESGKTSLQNPQTRAH